jgi:hypothetical protein
MAVPTPFAVAPEPLSRQYRVYGLALRSEVAIDGLVPSASASSIDCEIHLGEVVPLAHTVDVSWLEEQGEPGARVTRSGSAVVLEYRDGTRFHVDGGRITTSWTTTAEDMASYLLGPVLALVLRQHGRLVLHASGVVVDGKAILLAGAAGAGKSTTAAAFVARGAALITDDVAAIEWSDGHPHVACGYARIRLWSDSAAALFGSAEALPLLTPTWEKRYVDATERSADEAVPLGSIVILGGRGDETRLRRLEGHEAVMAVLARMSVPALVEEGEHVREFEQIAHVVSKTPVFELQPRSDLDATPALVDAIVAALA